MRNIGFVTALLLAPYGCPGEAIAQTAHPDLASAQSWVAAQLSLVKDGKGLPRLDDPVAAPMLRAALDTAAIHALDLNDIATLNERCEGPTSWSRVYLTGDAVILQIPNIDPLAKLQTPITRANEIRYIDELTLFSEAGYMCIKRLALAVTILYRANRSHTDNEDFRQGLASIRIGTAGMLQGLIMMQADPHIAATNKAALTTAMLDESEDAVAPLNKAQRTDVLARLDKFFLSANLTNREALIEFGHRIEQAPCTDLCLLP